MRTWAIIISIVVAVVIAITTSVGIGILIALACVVYQVMLELGRSYTGPTSKTALRLVLLGVIVRNVMFLIPLIIALINGFWFAAGATVMVFGVNLMMS